MHRPNRIRNRVPDADRHPYDIRTCSNSVDWVQSSPAGDNATVNGRAQKTGGAEVQIRPSDQLSKGRGR